MCSKLEAEVKSPCDEIKVLRESKSMCQHDMELLLEQTDPVGEEWKRANSMAILQKNIAEREAKLRALDNH